MPNNMFNHDFEEALFPSKHPVFASMIEWAVAKRCADNTNTQSWSDEEFTYYLPLVTVFFIAASFCYIILDRLPWLAEEQDAEPQVEPAVQIPEMVEVDKPIDEQRERIPEDLLRTDFQTPREWRLGQQVKSLEIEVKDLTRKLSIKSLVGREADVRKWALYKIRDRLQPKFLSQLPNGHKFTGRNFPLPDDWEHLPDVLERILCLMAAEAGVQKQQLKLPPTVSNPFPIRRTDKTVMQDIFANLAVAVETFSDAVHDSSLTPFPPGNDLPKDEVSSLYPSLADAHQKLIWKGLIWCHLQQTVFSNPFSVFGERASHLSLEWSPGHESYAERWRSLTSLALANRAGFASHLKNDGDVGIANAVDETEAQAEVFLKKEPITGSSAEELASDFRMKQGDQEARACVHRAHGTFVRSLRTSVGHEVPFEDDLMRKAETVVAHAQALAIRIAVEPERVELRFLGQDYISSVGELGIVTRPGLHVWEDSNGRISEEPSIIVPAHIYLKDKQEESQEIRIEKPSQDTPAPQPRPTSGLQSGRVTDTTPPDPNLQKSQARAPIPPANPKPKAPSTRTTTNPDSGLRNAPARTVIPPKIPKPTTPSTETTGNPNSSLQNVPVTGMTPPVAPQTNRRVPMPPSGLRNVQRTEQSPPKGAAPVTEPTTEPTNPTSKFTRTRASNKFQDFLRGTVSNIVSQAEASASKPPSSAQSSQDAIMQGNFDVMNSTDSNGSQVGVNVSGRETPASEPEPDLQNYKAGETPPPPKISEATSRAGNTYISPAFKNYKFASYESDDESELSSVRDLDSDDEMA
jgi:hypothetical protein